MILQCQWGSTIKVSIELPVATRHGHDMTEKLLKVTLNPNKQQQKGKQEQSDLGLPFVFRPKTWNHYGVICFSWIIYSILLKNIHIWARTWQHQQSDCAPSEDSDQPGHPPSLIRVFAGRMKKAWVLSYPLSAQWRLWSDWADAQADLSLCWAHSYFVGFVMSRLTYFSLVPSNQNIQELKHLQGSQKFQICNC